MSLVAGRSGDDARIAVTDTGPASRSTSASGSSRPSSAADRSVRASAEGTGLGLTLSRRIVELHGGRLSLDCPAAGGSIFAFTLPASARIRGRRRSGTEPARQRDGPDGPRHRGRPPLRRPAAALPRARRIRRHDRRRRRRGSARGAPAAARGRAPRPLPPDDGRLGGPGDAQGDPATAETPVVIVSMLDEDGAGLALGAADYLVKPVSQDELMRVLLRCGAPRIAQDRRRRSTTTRPRSPLPRPRSARPAGRCSRRETASRASSSCAARAPHRAARSADARPRRIHGRGAAARRSRCSPRSRSS